MPSLWAPNDEFADFELHYKGLIGTNPAVTSRVDYGFIRQALVNGPRGLASIVFAVIVVNANLPNSGSITMIVVCTIILSIVLHGVIANPWARAYGERSRRAQAGEHA